MKTIVMYEADDGRRFTDLVAAEAHERLHHRVQEIVAKNLGHRPFNIPNGSGYVQQNPSVVEAVRIDLTNLLNELSGHNLEPGPLAARVAMDGARGPLSIAFERLLCIDSFGREWSQPFYAINPGSGNNVMLEDRR